VKTPERLRHIRLDFPIAPKITPSRSWLVASRARKQAMSQSLPKSLPHGRGSFASRARKQAMSQSLPKITPSRSWLVASR